MDFRSIHPYETNNITNQFCVVVSRIIDEWVACDTYGLNDGDEEKFINRKWMSTVVTVGMDILRVRYENKPDRSDITYTQIQKYLYRNPKIQFYWNPWKIAINQLKIRVCLINSNTYHKWNTINLWKPITIHYL